jgi:tRNA(Ile)-lysidine synthase
LLGLTVGWAARSGEPPPACATVDHGLRAEAASEAASVTDFATALGAPHAVLPWRGHKGVSPSQAAARAARYRLLVAHARSLGADTILTAHTRDDQAETVLMRLARGSGLRGLAGMPAASALEDITLRRPLLSIAKARLAATCSAMGWPFVTDPSNGAPRYARARWRALMPALAAEGLDSAALHRFARRIAAADAAIGAAADALLGPIEVSGAAHPWRLDATAWGEAPAAVTVRALERILSETRPAPSRDPLLTPDGPRLSRIEAAAEALSAARREGRGVQLTLAGQVLRLSPEGVLTGAPEPPRRRGRPHSP